MPRSREDKIAFNDRTYSALAMLKLEAGCKDCGYAENPVALDFDHVRGIKKFHFNSAGTRSWARILEELEKCEVVCANCHRIRTVERRNGLHLTQ